MNNLILISVFGLLFFSCNFNNTLKDNNSLFSFLQEELKNDFLDTNFKERKKIILKEKTNFKIYYQKTKNRTKEIDIYLYPSQDTIYNFICNFYNSKFKQNFKNKNFNTWQTDSSEYILFKNSDSSILVNIYRKK